MEPESFTLFPIRCSNCGGSIGKYQQQYEQLIMAGHTPAEVLDILGVSRYCCRSNILCPMIIPFGRGQFENVTPTNNQLILEARTTKLRGTITEITNNLNTISISSYPSPMEISLTPKVPIPPKPVHPVSPIISEHPSIPPIPSIPPVSSIIPINKITRPKLLPSTPTSGIVIPLSTTKMLPRTTSGSTKG